MKVIVVGAGWAGLATAVELARRGVAVTLLEAARQLGGRARALRFGAHRVDNGQHLLLGAYREVLSLLSTLGVAEEQVFRRLPLRLTLYDRSGHAFELAAPRLPAPLHTGWALVRARGLSFQDKRLAVRVMAAARAGIAHDLPLAEFLRAHDQSETLVRNLWRPLCLAALNTPLEVASAAIFLNVLRGALLGPRAASDLLLPATDLGRCLPEPARDFVEQHGGNVRLGERVTGLAISGGSVAGVHSARGTLAADAIVVATGPRAAAELLRAHPALAVTAGAIDALGSAPICTLYLQYPRHARLPQPFVGLLDAHVQWLFDRGQLTHEPGLMTAVISGPGAHMRLDAASLTAHMIADIARHFPDWPAPESTRLVRERQATFLAAAGCEHRRPGNATPVAGLWLAGDYTDTGYPGTLEGAALSGVQCARLILDSPRQYERLSAAS